MSTHASNRVVTRYLAGYAEPEIQLLADVSLSCIPENQFNHVLVIPAYKESSRFYDRLAGSLMLHYSVLLIVVINQPDNLIKPDIRNQTLWNNICEHTTVNWQAEQLQLRVLPKTSSAVLLVDRFSELPVPEKQGVGLARKIGADLALYLISNGLVSQPWIYNSDADTHLPGDYFSVLDDSPAAVAIFPFQHIGGTPELERATRLYELRLRQYVDGLRAAGSPYAYHTLGSTLAISALAYAQVRGFPKRNGGEDFYLLNKVAKTGVVLSLPKPLIHITARQSDRVPFGTGPAVERLLSTEPLGQAEIFYHPDVFKHLAQWLNVIPNTWSRPIGTLGLPTLTLNALQSLGIDKAIAGTLRNSRSQQTYVKHIHTWFDGFRTLRFIHLLRDSGLPNVALSNSEVS